MTKSPGGSTFPYYYKGGEIHSLKYGGFYSDGHALEMLMREEEKFIRDTNRKLRIWIDLYKTRLSKDVLIKLADNISNLNEYTIKLALVGCSPLARWRLGRLVRERRDRVTVPIRYFADPEEAKTWLVKGSR